MEQLDAEIARLTGRVLDNPDLSQWAIDYWDESYPSIPRIGYTHVTQDIVLMARISALKHVRSLMES